MAANNFIRYEEETKLEVYGPTCVKAKSYLTDVRAEIKAEKQILSNFLTVKEFSKNLGN